MTGSLAVWDALGFAFHFARPPIPSPDCEAIVDEGRIPFELFLKYTARNTLYRQTWVPSYKELRLAIQAPGDYSTRMDRTTIQKVVAAEAWLAGLAALAYAFAFVVARNPFASALFLMLTGLFAVKVFLALYGRLRDVQTDVARAALLFAALGAIGSFIHGGFDLANVLNPPASPLADLPSQVDPRGLLTFAATGSGIVFFSWLMGHHTSFPTGLRRWGYVSGALLIIIYLARLTILDPAHPLLLYPVLAQGFVVGPIWYLWIAWLFQQRKI